MPFYELCIALYEAVKVPKIKCRPYTNIAQFGRESRENKRQREIYV